MFTHVVTRGYRDSSGSTISSTESPTGNAESNLDIQIAASATNQHILFNITRSQLQSMCIEVDEILHIFTNDLSTGSPTDTINLIAGQNTIWTLATDLIAKCPISADITAGIYVTNPSSTLAVNLKVRTLRNE